MEKKRPQPPNPGRRDFLKKFSTAAVGVLANSLLTDAGGVIVGGATVGAGRRNIQRGRGELTDQLTAITYDMRAYQRRMGGIEVMIGGICALVATVNGIDRLRDGKWSG